MSRMIKKQLHIVDGIKFSTKGEMFVVSNEHGSVEINLNKMASISIENGLEFKSLVKKDDGTLGTLYVLVKNAMNDLKNGVSAKLKMVGVGFKACVTGKFLRVYVGLSHDIFFAIPSDLTVEVSNDVDIVVKGYNRCSVMRFARMVRDIKKPEPYKCKGIFLNDEKIIKKEGKKK